MLDRFAKRWVDKLLSRRRGVRATLPTVHLPRTLLSGLVIVCSFAPADAHHSFVVEYDVKSPVALEGVVTRFEWASPHAYLYIDVIETDGHRTPWTFEMASPNVLGRNGWTRRTLQAGDRVTLEGYGGVALTTRGTIRSIALADGRVLPAGDGLPTTSGQFAR